MLSRGVNDRRISTLPPHPECRLLLGTAIAADQSDGNSHTPSVLPQRLQIRDHRWCDAYAWGSGDESHDRLPDGATLHLLLAPVVVEEFWRCCEDWARWFIHPRNADSRAMINVIHPLRSWGKTSAIIRKLPET